MKTIRLSRLLPLLLLAALAAGGGCRALRSYFAPIPSWEQKASLANLKLIALALGAYRAAHDGELPAAPGAAGWAAAMPRLVERQPELFLAPFDRTRRPAADPARFGEENCSYRLIGGGFSRPAAEVRRPDALPVAFERTGLRGDGRLGVLYLDGHVALVEGDFPDDAAALEALMPAAADAAFGEDLRRNLSR